MPDVIVAVLLGLPMTLIVTGLSFAIGLVGGIPIMLGLRSRFLPVRIVFRFVVDLIRGIPPIVWLFLIYFGVQFGAIRMSSLAAAVTGLGIIASAYLAEMYRGGFQTLPTGQLEAAQALGLGRVTTFTQVLTPQAFRTILPSLTTYLISLIKDSSIASTIGVMDMVFMANQFARQSLATSGLTPFLVAAAVYLVISIPVAVFARRLDAKMKEVVS